MKRPKTIDTTGSGHKTAEQIAEQITPAELSADEFTPSDPILRNTALNFVLNGGVK